MDPRSSGSKGGGSKCGGRGPGPNPEKVGPEGGVGVEVGQGAMSYLGQRYSGQLSLRPMILRPIMLICPLPKTALDQGALKISLFFFPSPASGEVQTHEEAIVYAKNWTYS